MAEKRALVWVPIGTSEPMQMGTVHLGPGQVMVPYIEVEQADCPDLDTPEDQGSAR